MRRTLSCTTVICVYNGEGFIRSALESLQKQILLSKILVVDDGSTDGTSKILSELSAQDSTVKIITLEENSGLGPARNIALQNIDTDIAAFLDADGIASLEWTSQIVDFFEREPYSTAVMASSVRFAKNPKVFNGLGANLTITGYGYDLYYQEPVHLQVPYFVQYAMGNGLSVRAKVAKYIGGFDNTIKNYYDDVDFCLRVWKAGFSVKTNPQAIVEHFFGHSTQENPDSKIVMVERNRLLAVYKNYSLRQLMHFFPREVKNIFRSRPHRSRLILSNHFYWIKNFRSLIRSRNTKQTISVIPQLFVPLPVAWECRPNNHLGPVLLDVENRIQIIYGAFPSEKFGHLTGYWIAPKSEFFIRQPKSNFLDLKILTSPGCNLISITITSLETYLQKILHVQKNDILTIRIPTIGDTRFFVTAEYHREPGISGRSLGFAVLDYQEISEEDTILNDTCTFIGEPIINVKLNTFYQIISFPHDNYLSIRNFDSSLKSVTFVINLADGSTSYISLFAREDEARVELPGGATSFALLSAAINTTSSVTIS
jgi:GT2 family glycosyltransferase